MTTPAQPLELVEPLHVALVATAPHLPLILCNGGFMSSLKAVEAQARDLSVIKDAVGAQSAANLLQRATTAGTQLNKQRLELIRPFQDQIDAINMAAKGPAGRLEVVKGSLKVSQTNFNNEQRRLAQEAEQARQAELRRLEEIRLQEAAALKRKADEIAEQVRKENEARTKVVEAAKAAGLPIVEAEPEEVWDEVIDEPVQKSETELAIERLKFAPAPVVAKAQGVRETVVLFPVVRDASKLPEMFFTRTPKISAIQSVFCKGWRDGDAIPVLDGVEFQVQRNTVSTGRNGF